MLKGHVTFARDLLNNVVLDLAYYMRFVELGRCARD